MALPLVFASPITWAVIGVAMMLLWLATYYLVGKPMTEMARAIPLIGADLARGVTTITGNITRWALEWGKTGLDAVVEFLSVPVRAVQDAIGWGAYTVESIASQLQKLGAATVGEIGAMGRRVATVTNQVLSTVRTLATVVTGLANLRNLVNLLRSTVIPAAAAAAVATARAYTGQRVRGEADARRQGIANARNAAKSATAAEARYRQAGDAAGAAALGAAAAAIYAAIKAAQAADTHYTDVQTKGLQEELTQIRTQAIPKAEARATARANTVAAELAAVRLACVNPICSLFGPGSSFAATLFGQAEYLALLALVGQAVRDPEGTAGVMASVSRELHDMAGAVVGPFLGATA